jgi:two-component system, chemotaxis family, protein-glutamate methylesterase/glutaminase
MHVLIVDDSAVVRQTVSTLLHNEIDISVSVAPDPLIALQKIRANRPDVILLDIEMPRMDGLTFLAKLMAEDPIPVVILSAVAEARSEIAWRALQQGAMEIVVKPNVGLRRFLEESRVRLVDALRAAAAARTDRGIAPSRPASGTRRDRSVASARNAAGDDRIIAIGASTGGTQAIKAVLSGLPADAPGTLIVQHMPEIFTRHFARHLNAESLLDVQEAADGDRLTSGHALVAPGNRHASLCRDRDGYYVRLSDGPLVSRHRPSVDVMFRSVAEVAGSKAIGVILTGMGADGAEGMVEMKRAGAATIAQDEKTCVVFGMPKEAIRRGAIDEVAAIEDIALAIIRLTAALPVL